MITMKLHSIIIIAALTGIISSAPTGRGSLPWEEGEDDISKAVHGILSTDTNPVVKPEKGDQLVIPTVVLSSIPKQPPFIPRLVAQLENIESPSNTNKEISPEPARPMGIGQGVTISVSTPSAVVWLYEREESEQTSKSHPSIPTEETVLINYNNSVQAETLGTRDIVEPGVKGYDGFVERIITGMLKDMGLEVDLSDLSDLPGYFTDAEAAYNAQLVYERVGKVNKAALKETEDNLHAAAQDFIIHALDYWMDSTPLFANFQDPYNGEACPSFQQKNRKRDIINDANTPVAEEHKNHENITHPVSTLRLSSTAPSRLLLPKRGLLDYPKPAVWKNPSPLSDIYHMDLRPAGSLPDPYTSLVMTYINFGMNFLRQIQIDISGRPDIEALSVILHMAEDEYLGVWDPYSRSQFCNTDHWKLVHGAQDKMHGVAREVMHAAWRFGLSDSRYFRIGDGHVVVDFAGGQVVEHFQTGG